MRDTLCLRARITLLTCLPGVTAALGCSPPPAPQPVARDEAAPPDEAKQVRRERARERREAARARQADSGPPRVGTPPSQPAKTAPNIPPEAQNAMPLPTEVPGDPPYIDGYNPEEASCVSGNWCGAQAAAMPLAVKGVDQEMDCPGRIAGGQHSDAIESDPKTYAGLSSAPNMQGALNQHGTELARASSGDATTCCYHWFEYCSGRPHLDEAGPVLAAVRVQPHSPWLHDAAASALEPAVGSVTPPVVDPALRDRIAAAWREDARAEHASVAAFARATLELLAVGAPPALLEQAQRAGLDEIDHARRCFGLARRHGAPPMEPGPLPALAPRESSLARLAADTFAEGCVGETIAALVAQRAQRACIDPIVRESLAVIADDEARHAALAWSTIGWALEQGGLAVARALEETAAHLRASAPEALPDAEPDAAALAAHGRLDARAHALAAREAWTDVITPMLETLLRDASPRKV